MLASIIPASLLVALASASAIPARAISPRFSGQTTNWCGLVTSQTNITSVEATWTVPTVTTNSKGKVQYYAYQWLGIGGQDGLACGDLLQGGTATNIAPDGTVSYQAYYQIYGGSQVGANFASDLALAAGDSVYGKVTIVSASSGTVFLKNNRNGKTMTRTINSDKGRTICSTGSEFIQERPGDTSTNFPTFTAFSFSGVSGNTTTGTFNLSGAAADYIVDTDGTQLCHTSGATSSGFQVNNN